MSLSTLFSVAWKMNCDPLLSVTKLDDVTSRHFAQISSVSSAGLVDPGVDPAAAAPFEAV